MYYKYQEKISIPQVNVWLTERVSSGWIEFVPVNSREKIPEPAFRPVFLLAFSMSNRLLVYDYREDSSTTALGVLRYLYVKA